MAWSGSTTVLEWRQAGTDEYDKKGDKYLRTLFIYGACAVVRVTINNNDGGLHQWVNQLKERRGFNKTTYVKPFVRGQKNDGNDTQAIAIALMQPTMQFVPPKSPEQQDIQALHRARTVYC